MAQYIFPDQHNYGFGLTFNATGKAPLIAKRIFETYNDALSYAQDDLDSCVPGLILGVINDTNDDNNGAWFVKSIGSSAELEKVGSDVDLTNYYTKSETQQYVSSRIVDDTADESHVNTWSSYAITDYVMGKTLRFLLDGTGNGSIVSKSSLVTNEATANSAISLGRGQSVRAAGAVGIGGTSGYVYVNKTASETTYRMKLISGTPPANWVIGNANSLANFFAYAADAMVGARLWSTAQKLYGRIATATRGSNNYEIAFTVDTSDGEVAWPATASSLRCIIETIQVAGGTYPAVAIGDIQMLYGSSIFSIGRYNYANAATNWIIGEGNTTASSVNFIIGEGNDITTSGPGGNILSGFINHTSGTFNNVFGNSNNVATSNNTLLGIGLTSVYGNLTAVGKYNDSSKINDVNPLFQIGTGTSTTNRRNAMTVDANNNVFFNSTSSVYFGGTALSDLISGGGGGDLSNYYTKTETENYVSSRIVDDNTVFGSHTNAPSGYAVNAKLDDYYTKSETQNYVTSRIVDDNTTQSNTDTWTSEAIADYVDGHAGFSGSVLDNFAGVTPIETKTYNITSPSYRRLFTFTNSSEDLRSQTGWCEGTIDITNDAGTIDGHYSFLVKLNGNVCAWLQTQDLGATAATRGLYQFIVRTPNAANNGSDWMVDIVCTSANTTTNKRNVTLNIASKSDNCTIFATDDNVTYANTTATTITNSLNSLYYSNAGGVLQTTTSAANSALYSSNRENKYINTTLNTTGEAITAYTIVFSGADNKYYMITNTSQIIDVDSGVGVAYAAVNADTTLNAVYYANKCGATLNLTGVTANVTWLTGQNIYMKCTYPDSNGNIYSSAELVTTKTPGYTYLYLGKMTSTTGKISISTDGQPFISIDNNGYITHINGKEIEHSGESTAVSTTGYVSPDYLIPSISGHNDIYIEHYIPITLHPTQSVQCVARTTPTSIGNLVIINEDQDTILSASSSLTNFTYKNETSADIVIYIGVEEAGDEDRYSPNDVTIDYIIYDTLTSLATEVQNLKKKINTQDKVQIKYDMFDVPNSTVIDGVTYWFDPVNYITLEEGQVIEVVTFDYSVSSIALMTGISSSLEIITSTKAMDLIYKAPGHITDVVIGLARQNGTQSDDPGEYYVYDTLESIVKKINA